MVTESGVEWLTRELPRSATDIENFMARARATNPVNDALAIQLSYEAHGPLLAGLHNAPRNRDWRARAASAKGRHTH